MRLLSNCYWASRIDKFKFKDEWQIYRLLAPNVISELYNSFTNRIIEVHRDIQSRLTTESSINESRFMC